MSNCEHEWGPYEDLPGGENSGRWVKDFGTWTRVPQGGTLFIRADVAALQEAASLQAAAKRGWEWLNDPAQPSTEESLTAAILGEGGE